jgi:outer membrane PBP1 activator LpoA protein
MMRRLLILIIAAGLLAGCTTSYQADAQREAAIETAKQDIAAERRAGRITQEESVRRQYGVVSSYLSLSPGGEAYWRAAIFHASQLDAKKISRSEYDYRVAQAFETHISTEQRHREAIAAQNWAGRSRTCNVFMSSLICM